MHLTITRSLANNSITDLIQYHLTTFQTVKLSAICQKCFSIALNRKVVRKACARLNLLLASAPSYGKVHNVVYCYAFFFLHFLTSQKSKDDLWILKKAGLSAVKKMKEILFRNIIMIHI